MLKEVKVFFDLFAKPTVQQQAEKYPTLHNAIPIYLHLIRQMEVWESDDSKPFLCTMANAAYKVLIEYYKKSFSTRHSSVATICDPRYKLNLLEYIYEAEGGINSSQYKKSKMHFEHTFYRYRARTQAKADYRRAEAEDRDNLYVAGEDPDPDAWRNNPIDGYAAFVAQQRAAVQALPVNTELDRWFQEPCLPTDIPYNTMKKWLISKQYEFPIISEIIRDFIAIPATSAPTERVFSMAGNLISKKRARIASENVRYVLCLRSWGLLLGDDDEEVLQFNGDGEYRVQLEERLRSAEAPEA